MKRVTDMLGLARSNIAARVRGVRPKRGFAIARWRSRLELANAIRRLVDARPTPAFAGAGSTGTGGSPRSSSASGDPTVWPRSTPSVSTG
jgi:hypothetical protein